MTEARRIGVTPPRINAYPRLRAEVKAALPDALLYEGGKTMGENELVAFLKDCDAAIVGFEPLMSGRRPLIKGFLAALRTSRVRSCLRPVDADFSPLALMVRPPGSLPQSPKRAHIGAERISGFRAFPWFTSPLGHPRFRFAPRRKSFAQRQAPTGWPA
jgi:hypothetical protein